MINNINLDDTVMAISELTSEISLLSACIEKLAKGSATILESALKGLSVVGDVATTALGGVASAVTILVDGEKAIENFHEAAAVIAPALSGFMNMIKGIIPKVLEFCSTLSASTIATGFHTIATNAHTAATNIATAATKLLDLAMKNLPLVAVIAGIAALVAGLAIFINHINKTSEEQKRLNAETAELKKKNEELTKSMKDSEDTYKNNTDKMALQAGTAEKLAEKVFELSEKENKSAEEKQQLALMVDELNNAMPGLNLLYDEEADLLNKSSDAVYGLIAAKKEELLQEAMAERAVELLKEQLELEYQREEVSKKISEWENATDVKDDARKKAIADLQTQYSDLTVKIDETEGAVNSVMDSIIESSERQAEAVKGASEEMTEDWKAYQEGVENSAKAAEEAAEREKAALKEREEKLKSYKEAATDMFNAIDRESKVSVESMIDNLKNNQTAVKEWSEGLEDLARRGVDEGILEELRKGGPQAAGLVNELVQATDGQLEELCAVFANGGSVATEALLTELGLPAVVSAGSDMVDDMAESMANNSNLEKETVRLIKTTLNTAAAEINNGGFVKAGIQIAEGLAQGVRDGTDILVQAVRQMANAAVSAARSALQINSPSRVFRDEVGLMVALGFSAGIEDGLDNISTAALKMSDKAANGLDLGFMKAMQKLSDKVGNVMPVFATGQIVPAHTPYSSIISNSDNHSTAFTQNIQLTGSDMSDAQKIRLLQIQSRRMLKLGV